MTIEIPGLYADPPVPRALAPRAKATVFMQERLAIALLSLIAGAFLYWPLWRALMPLEMSPNEAWNAWYTDAALHGRPLYPGMGELVVNNYPPLSFYLVGFASIFTPDPIYAGRLVSLLSLGVVAFSISLSVRQLGGSRAAAVFGAVFFIATIACFFTRYVAIDDPNTLALAAMGSALAFFLTRLRSGKPVGPAIACMVAAGFIKHSLVALPLTALIWLILTQPRAGLRASLLGTALVLLGLAICWAAYGTGFFHQLLMPRVLTIARTLRAANKIQVIAPALLFWGLWAWTRRDKPAARFSALLLGISYVACSTQTAGEGVVHNAFFELIFASSIAVALVFGHIQDTPLAKHLGAVQAQRVMIMVLVIRLLIGQHAAPYHAIFSQEFRQEIRHKLVVMNAEIERIKAIPGPVFCSNMTVCYRAGKAFVYDPFWVRQKLSAGTMSQEEINNVIERAGIRFEQIDPELAIHKSRLFSEIEHTPSLAV
ncbi:MAG: hypothetical protein WBX25_17475 [Rhodomicrobium sp.]